MNKDKALISKLQNRDEAALSLLYDKYSAALYGVILRICKDEAKAQNLLQDTFMTIWEKAGDYDLNKGSFYTWAYRIARNKTLNFIRKNDKLIQVEDLSVYKDRTEDVNEAIDVLKLKGSISKLEMHHQRAIELVYFNGLTHREAREEMNVPLGTFKSYIKQAIKQLQKAYLTVAAFLLVLIEVLR
ncbi:RNA polymerase sigma factor [Psychroserpens sp.]|uniref:RNA polymerase sigma factor n=1 Tax=Psychroserpens sp. TaxID=2020870 RepID=UPI001B1E765D|nr:sigma-70 family RNA polymerase sigma factor [Psychroserpens sp.]MBO6607140.1 sigma-70 family RNA polymerase sigma factor [Psychroserpens sp.]MBO6632261.1 sigma-70 family RNA polymerase sigma factor [Psychroserpens sp.]MBO6654286.1 sigma-70 family RNA polymerase sigma factor [Psychroserpens sp.]MBO6682428.1 sigma-70 family RNA polymerase sigma factor [Psychroserpens sp.]MBO6750912.1 sigma-70 family RNA polymerase sigma factor [Psychroserpens sp.]